MLQCLNAKTFGGEPYLYYYSKAPRYKIERSKSIDYTQKSRDMNTLVHMARMI